MWAPRCADRISVNIADAANVDPSDWFHPTLAYRGQPMSANILGKQLLARGTPSSSDGL
jgi:hypothetical protein